MNPEHPNIPDAEHHLADSLHRTLEQVDGAVGIGDAAGARTWAAASKDLAEGLAALAPPAKLGRLFERT